MEPYVITEKDQIKTLYLNVLLVILAYTALIALYPSGIDNIIDHAFRDLESFVVFLFFVLGFMLPVCRLIKHFVRSRKEERVLLKVDEKGLYLNNVQPLFLKWAQIDRIVIGGKFNGSYSPLYLEVFRKRERVISFCLEDYIGNISTSDLIEAINTFSGRPDMLKIRKWYE